MRREAALTAVNAERTACCTPPAGESPVPVGAGAPGSRPTIGVERSLIEAGCQKPLRREQVLGPQHEVKSAASSHLQSGSRAAHFTVKATSAVQDPERTAGPGGVGGVARAQGEVRNTRGPSSRPLSGQSTAYKPRAKSPCAERESEGAVVPKKPVQQNSGKGKGPCFGSVGAVGTREGMTGR